MGRFQRGLSRLLIFGLLSHWVLDGRLVAARVDDEDPETESFMDDDNVSPSDEKPAPTRKPTPGAQDSDAEVMPADDQPAAAEPSRDLVQPDGGTAIRRSPVDSLLETPGEDPLRIKETGDFPTGYGCGNLCGCCDACGCGGTAGGCFWPIPGQNPHRLFCQDRAIRVRGWMDGGILGNASNPASHFNGPYNSQQVDNGQFNQAYLIIDRELSKDSFSVGGRADVLYGADYYVAQSNGIERSPAGAPVWNSSQYYGLALPQLYAEVGRQDTSLKLGHFYSIVGYESVQSVNNFFYSHAYSYQFAGPFTHWGLMGTKKINNWQFQLGLVNGWNGLVQSSNHLAFMPGVKYASDSGRWWSSFAIITGNEATNPAGLPNVPNGNANRTRYSFLLSRSIGERAEYVFHQWAGVQQSGEAGGVGPAKWYGLDQYLYYTLNERVRLATRVEWFRDEDGTRVGLTEPSNPNKAPLPGSYASWTVGFNWAPRANVLLRPEIRWDTYQGSAKPFDDGKKTDQFLYGFDAIVQF